jgi:NADPH-dependent 2,4-dienoyl-CoA reductase/sulfur reductase-like enzyme/nitrite reductase/ring-hydroxylating ferredoxin subunit
MSHTSKDLTGPDLTTGVPEDSVAESGTLLGRVGDQQVVVVRSDGEFFAIGATCTHYKGPLAEGLVVGKTVRCPWHHACFNLETGRPDPPALDPVPRWRVERHGGRLVVKDRLPDVEPPDRADPDPGPMVIVGGGAAGLAAALTLRAEGYRGRITMISADRDAPYDRPNLSKDYLAGSAPEDWMPLRDDQFFKDASIDLILGAKVSRIDTAGRRVELADGRFESYGALLLATGASPIRLNVPGADLPHVHYLRSFDDARAIIAKLSPGVRVAIVGASFIGLEVAAALRTRGAIVHVIDPAARPMERVFGAEVAEFVRALHESHGVMFHLRQQVAAIEEGRLTLADGSTLAPDLVVVGIGVRPSISLAEEAGLAIDRGIHVNEYLETNASGVFAAGDIARWPDPHSRDRIRVEHWVVAERQGQVAARNMLGLKQRFDAVPFFWSQHYDVTINYVGHAESWDDVARDGRLEDRDCSFTYRRAGRTLAVATIGRDHESLVAERAIASS